MKQLTITKNNSPLVSILMNCYNGEKFLKNSLLSILDQTYANWEIIFWDNLSTDKSADIFKSFKDDRFKYYKADNHTNLGDARALAWNYIRGDYVAILDVDDIANRVRIETQLKFFIKNKNLAAIGSYCEIINEDNKIILNQKLPLKHLELKDLLLWYYPFNSVTVMYNKKCVDDVGGYNNKFKMINDYDLMLRLSKKFEVINVSTFLGKNRQHKNNLSFLMKLDGQLELLELLKKNLSDTKNVFFIKKIKKSLSIVSLRVAYYSLKNINIPTFLKYTYLSIMFDIRILKFIFTFSKKSKEEYISELNTI